MIVRGWSLIYNIGHGERSTYVRDFQNIAPNAALPTKLLLLPLLLLPLPKLAQTVQ